MEASPQNFQKMNCKVFQQRSGLLNGPLNAKVSQNQLGSFEAKVRSSKWIIHRKRFTKGIANFCRNSLVLSVRASPQKFHKINCKVSQQRFGLICGGLTARLSQNYLQSFAAKVPSSQWMLHHKRFTK